MCLGLCLWTGRTGEEELVLELDVYDESEVAFEVNSADELWVVEVDVEVDGDLLRRDRLDVDGPCSLLGR